MIKVTLDIAKQWNWDKIKAVKLITDIQTYHLAWSPFAGGTTDGLVWWEHLIISSKDHSLKAFAITILSIVPHASDVEHLFSDLGNTQSPWRCNLSVSTFEMLGKIHANLNYHIHTTKAANGKKTRCRHAHMHTRDQPGINVDVTKDLKERFTWVPPLLAHSDEDLAGPKAISLDEVDALLSAFKQVVEGEEVVSVGGRGVVEGGVYSFEELDQVDKGIAPRQVDEVVEVVDHNRWDDEGWDVTMLMLSNGLDSHSGSLLVVFFNSELWVLPHWHNWQNPGFCRFCRYYRQNLPKLVLPTMLCVSLFSCLQVMTLVCPYSCCTFCRLFPYIDVVCPFFLLGVLVDKRPVAVIDVTCAFQLSAVRMVQ